MVRHLVMGVTSVYERIIRIRPTRSDAPRPGPVHAQTLENARWVHCSQDTRPASLTTPHSLLFLPKLSSLLLATYTHCSCSGLDEGVLGTTRENTITGGYPKVPQRWLDWSRERYMT